MLLPLYSPEERHVFLPEGQSFRCLVSVCVCAEGRGGQWLSVHECVVFRFLWVPVSVGSTILGLPYSCHSTLSSNWDILSLFPLKFKIQKTKQNIVPKNTVIGALE